MNQTQKLLETIIENARLGEYACEQLLNKTEDEEMRRELALEKKEYVSIAGDAEKRLERMGLPIKHKDMGTRMGMWMGMQMNTMMDKTSTHIAEMLIEGATMGVVEITKARNSFPDADADSHGIASRMITKQQEAIDRLKKVLRLQEA
ncbi:MAG: hypothetical protein IJ466_08965 [Clostridia bacterium]|nr:hypothetical protein [Clostridia bacterium]